MSELITEKSALVRRGVLGLAEGTKIEYRPGGECCFKRFFEVLAEGEIPRDTDGKEILGANVKSVVMAGETPEYFFISNDSEITVID